MGTLRGLGTSIVERSVELLEPPLPHSVPFDFDTGPCWCCTDCRRDLTHRRFDWHNFQKRLALDAGRAVPREREYQLYN